jgi:hypothetical protein
MQASTLKARVSGAFFLALHVKGDALAARHSRGERQISNDYVPIPQLHLRRNDVVSACIFPTVQVGRSLAQRRC